MAPAGKVPNRTVTMASYPEAAPEPSNFGLVTTDFDLDQPLKDGELMLQNVFVTMDPYMRSRMRPGVATYVTSFEIGGPISGYGVSKIIKSANPKYKEGWFISTVLTLWSDYQILTAAEIAAQETNKMLVLIDPEEETKAGVPLPFYVGPLGTSGITAWVGLFVKGKPKKGETVLVSAAAGAVGQSVCIFAKDAGCKVVGIAGGADKCRRIQEDLGIDPVIDYKNPKGGSVLAAIREAAPEGIDVYFDNVGGSILEAAIQAANHGARMPICGQISLYNTDNDSVGVLSPAQQQLIKEKAIEYGLFNVRDHRAQYFDQAVGDLRSQISRGLWKSYALDIRPGLENAGQFYSEMMAGKNQGKAICQIRDPRA